jgi:hypothetical protein
LASQPSAEPLSRIIPNCSHTLLLEAVAVVVEVAAEAAVVAVAVEAVAVEAKCYTTLAAKTE